MHLNKLLFLMIFISSLFLINSNNVNGTELCAWEIDNCGSTCTDSSSCQCIPFGGGSVCCPIDKRYAGWIGCADPITTQGCHPERFEIASRDNYGGCQGVPPNTAVTFVCTSITYGGNCFYSQTVDKIDCCAPGETFDENTGCCNGVSPTHRECSNNQCVSVTGPGPNDCNTNADCQPPQFHLECVNQQCVQVSGPGVNQCTNNNDCIPPSQQCTINTYQITPDCSLNDPNCETGEKINVNVNYDKDNCPNPSYIQIDATNTDCSIGLNLTGNDNMYGITSSCKIKKIICFPGTDFCLTTITCTPWTIPRVADDCLGDTITSNKISLYDYNDYSNLITSLTQNDGSFTFSSRSQCASFNGTCNGIQCCPDGDADPANNLFCSTTTNTCQCPVNYRWNDITQKCELPEVPCSLTEAYFSLDGNNPDNNLKVNDETPVSINIKGNDPVSCNSQQVILEYWDKDGTTRGNIDPSVTLPLATLRFTNDLASTTWTAQWFDDNNDPQGDHFPDYQFEASIGLISKKISNILEVKNTPYNNENTCSDFNPNAKCEQQCTSQGLECVDQLGSVPGCTNCCICGLTQDFDDGTRQTKVYEDCIEDSDTEDQYGTVKVTTTIKDQNGKIIEGPSTSTEQCTLIKDVPVPFFGLLNLLIVALLITIYYILKKKEYI